MEDKTFLNFAIPTNLSLRIDRLLIDLRERRLVYNKTKPELLIELLEIGYNAKIQSL